MRASRSVSTPTVRCARGGAAPPRRRPRARRAEQEVGHGEQELGVAGGPQRRHQVRVGLRPAAWRGRAAPPCARSGAGRPRARAACRFAGAARRDRGPPRAKGLGWAVQSASEARARAAPPRRGSERVRADVPIRRRRGRARAPPTRPDGPPAPRGRGRGAPGRPAPRGARSDRVASAVASSAHRPVPRAAPRRGRDALPRGAPAERRPRGPAPRASRVRAAAEQRVGLRRRGGRARRRRRGTRPSPPMRARGAHTPRPPVRAPLRAGVAGGGARAVARHLPEARAQRRGRSIASEPPHERRHAERHAFHLPGRGVAARPRLRATSAARPSPCRARRAGGAERARRGAQHARVLLVRSEATAGPARPSRAAVNGLGQRVRGLAAHERARIAEQGHDVLHERRVLLAPQRAHRRARSVAEAEDAPARSTPSAGGAEERASSAATTWR